mgnify:CR=1 FL=1
MTIGSQKEGGADSGGDQVLRVPAVTAGVKEIMKNNNKIVDSGSLGSNNENVLTLQNMKFDEYVMTSKDDHDVLANLPIE